MTSNNSVSNEQKWPEHEKMAKVQVESQAIGEFIEWLGSQDMLICRATGEEKTDYPYIPAYENIERLLARHFNIDLTKIEEEKRAMLEEMRRANQK